jgi:outer membrane lipoprotein carrier protein
LNSHSRITIALVLFLLGFILPARTSPDDQLSTIMRGIRDRYGNAGGLTSAYSREAITKTMVVLGITERHDMAKGRLFFRPPHMLRLEQVSPQEELLLTDGQTMWWYIPQKEEAYKYSAERFGKELRILSQVLQGLKRAEHNFKISYKEILEDSSYQLILRPEPPWQDIDRLEILIRKGNFAITQVDIFNSIGGLTRFIFSGWRKNVSLEQGLFAFTPPSGTKVMEK